MREKFQKKVVDCKDFLENYDFQAGIPCPSGWG